ncbi:unnamed protein product, partial [Iphiclides podalirius]
MSRFAKAARSLYGISPAFGATWAPGGMRSCSRPARAANGPDQFPRRITPVAPNRLVEGGESSPTRFNEVYEMRYRGVSQPCSRPRRSHGFVKVFHYIRCGNPIRPPQLRPHAAGARLPATLPIPSSEAARSPYSLQITQYMGQSYAAEQRRPHVSCAALTDATHVCSWRDGGSGGVAGARPEPDIISAYPTPRNL